MFNKTIKDLLKEKNKDIDIKNLTERGYVKVYDLYKLNRDGNLLDVLKELLNDEKDAHFLNKIITEEIRKTAGIVTVIGCVLLILLFYLW